MNKRAIDNSAGTTPDAIVISSRDITKHKQAEERIRFQSQLLEAVGQAVIATDPQGKIIYWNQAAEEMYGWSAKEVMGCSIMEVTPSEELMEQAETIMTELMAGKSWSGEFVVQRKDGTTFPTMVTDTPVYDEQGNLIAIIGVSTDITELKQTEKLRRSEERFRLLVEGVKDYAIFMLDSEGRITSWNAGAERIKAIGPRRSLAGTSPAFTPKRTSSGVTLRRSYVSPRSRVVTRKKA